MQTLGLRSLAAVLICLALAAAAALPALAEGTRIVRDETGREVVIPAKPQRIVALTPWVVEMLVMLGKPPVGRPSSADWPAEALKIPEHGLAYRLNYERIAALKPDLLIGNKDLHAPYLGNLQQVGAPVLLYMIDSYKDVSEKFKILGDLVGESEKAAKLAGEIERRVEATRKKVPATGHPRVLIMVGSAEAWSAAKPTSYLGDMVKLLGGVNIAETGPEHRPGYTKLSMERVVEANPDVLILVKPVRDASDKSKALPGFAKDPMWNTLKAVKNGRVVELDPFYFTSPGPRYADALEQVAAVLYPEVFRGDR
ncbi:MAG: ABC transporter substrate-binding protein [Bacillota bacterium]|nr:ABC transporter substrate-binding protein [Bacillota bacterium]